MKASAFVTLSSAIAPNLDQIFGARGLIRNSAPISLFAASLASGTLISSGSNLVGRHYPNLPYISPAASPSSALATVPLLQQAQGLRTTSLRIVGTRFDFSRSSLQVRSRLMFIGIVDLKVESFQAYLDWQSMAICDILHVPSGAPTWFLLTASKPIKL